MKKRTRVMIIAAILALAGLTGSGLVLRTMRIQEAGDEWWQICPPDPPTRTPWPPQPTYTPGQMPTCRPTATLAPNPSPTPYPTSTPYPTQPYAIPTETVEPTGTTSDTPTPTGTPAHTSTPAPAHQSYDDGDCGHTVTIPNGTYTQLTINARCSAQSPLIIVAQTTGHVFFDGQGTQDPCQISISSYVTVEGITCHNSDDVVVNLTNSDHITLRQVTAYQAGPDYGDHIFNIYRSENVTLEDCAATGRGRNTYIAYESDFITFRRCWGRYVTNGTEQGADWMQIYGSADCLIENCVGTRKPSDIHVDVNQYWYASWNRDQDRVDRNRTIGSVFYGHDYHGLNIISANQQLHGNSVENTVFIGNDTTAGFGIPYTAILQRGDDSFTLDHLTLVNHQTAINFAPHGAGHGVPCFDIDGTATNSSIVNGSTGIAVGGPNSDCPNIVVALDHHHNNFYDVDIHYSGTTGGPGDTSVNPGYDTAQYGLGAYLFVPPALKGQGENGADIGAEVLYRSVEGILIGTRLWPWFMEARICAETANLLGEGQSVTYEAHQVEYDYDGDGQPETYTCTGGIWKTLLGHTNITQFGGD